MTRMTIRPDAFHAGLRLGGAAVLGITLTLLSTSLPARTGIPGAAVRSSRTTL